MDDKQIALSYVKNLGMEDVEWFGNDVECNTELCLGVVLYAGGLSLEVIKHSHFEVIDEYNNWLSADDCSWSGPVRDVILWHPIYNFERKRDLFPYQ